MYLDKHALFHSDVPVDIIIFGSYIDDAYVNAFIFDDEKYVRLGNYDVWTTGTVSILPKSDFVKALKTIDCHQLSMMDSYDEYGTMFDLGIVTVKDFIGDVAFTGKVMKINQAEEDMSVHIRQGDFCELHLPNNSVLEPLEKEYIDIMYKMWWDQ